MINALPLKKLNTVYHVGSLNSAEKFSSNSISYEGNGLSISTHPEDWRRIARLGDAPVWKLEKNGTFLNFRKMTSAQKYELMQWGIRNQYIEMQDRTDVHIYDEDDLSIKVFTYIDQEQAKGQWDETEIMKIETLPKPVATPKLSDAIQMLCPEGLTMSMLATIYAEKILEIDGVWWEDVYDPMHLSAPRGVINKTSLSTWRISIHNKADQQHEFTITNHI